MMKIYFSAFLALMLLHASNAQLPVQKFDSVLQQGLAVTPEQQQENHILAAAKINECATNNGGCGQHGTCVPNPAGKSVCTCAVGYEGKLCKDINECATSTHGCDPTSTTCTNTDGSFTCACKTGYVPITGNTKACDLNECAAGTHNCDSTSTTCTNTDGSFTCDCKTGYVRFSDPKSCDVDECAAGTHNCDSASTTCTNTDGSFTCDCKTGYVRFSDPKSCDVDECAAGTHNCDSASTTCTNTDGSFTCACKTGYVSITGITNRCDFNECAAGTHNCDIHATCTNTDGSFTCTCNTASGYIGNGVSCKPKPTPPGKRSAGSDSMSQVNTRAEVASAEDSESLRIAEGIANPPLKVGSGMTAVVSLLGVLVVLVGVAIVVLSHRRSQTHVIPIAGTGV